MLNILRRIVQEINASAHFNDALQILVKRVREAMATEATSIFLIDKLHKEYVLLATDGLNPAAVGKTHIKMGEGLVGLVGLRGEPINIDNAPAHPNFLAAPEVGEERYKAFLGVPIIYNRRLLGILVVQQQKKRRFDEAEEAFLVTMSAQLGGVIAHAEATGTISQLLNASVVQNPTKKDIVFPALPGAPGICIGTVVVVYPLADLDAIPHRKTKNIAAECKTFSKALRAARADIRKLKKRLAHLPEEERALFDAYLLILDSEHLENEVLTVIQSGLWAPTALRKVIHQHVQQFLEMDDDYLRERATDMRDLGRRILMHLQSAEHAHPSYPENTILVGEEVTASNLAEVPKGHLVGVVTKQGSSNSHVAIIARAMGIPIVIAVESLPISELEGHEIIVDALEGYIYVAPSAKLRNNYNKLITQQRAFTANLEQFRHLPAETLDGQNISLWVNTGLTSDATLALTAGAEGIGLYRTEIPFMDRDRFPAEEEQYLIYRQLLSAFAPRPVIMRTLDIGGDKNLTYFPVVEDNPFLGWRGIRITLDHPEIFLVQIRAMLRANIGLDNLQIMLPMISSLQEADDALRFIQQAFAELRAENLPVTMPPVGVMIEVPSAIYQAPALAHYVDFLSVGSNDLTQYLLAVDRNNARVANLYDALHPAVLHALVQIVEAAHNAGKRVSICGEMASDPIAVPLLLAMGFDALSMNATALPQIKWVIRHCHLQQAKELLGEVLLMQNTAAIRQRMQQALVDLGLGELVRRK